MDLLVRCLFVVFVATLRLVMKEYHQQILINQNYHM